MTQKYKDVIKVNPKTEPNLALDFRLFLDLLASDSRWIGLTQSEKEKENDTREFLIWTDLEVDSLPFDEYDFEIRSVRTTDTEMQLKLKVLGKAESKRESSSFQCVDGQSFDISNVQWSDYEPKKIVNAVLGFIFSIKWNWHGIKQSVEFILVTLVYLISEVPNLIRFVGEFTLRLIHVCTPVALAIIDMLSKIFGVLLMLITDVIRSSRNRRQPPPSQRPQQLTYR